MNLEQAKFELNKIKKGINLMSFLSYAAIILDPQNTSRYIIEIGFTVRDSFSMLGYNQKKEVIKTDSYKANEKKLLKQYSDSHRELNSSDYFPRLSHGIMQINNLTGVNLKPFDCSTSQPDKTRHILIKAGISIANKKDKNLSGTLGGIFKLQGDSSFYAITNRHVVHYPYARSRLITQPSKDDLFSQMGGQTNDIGQTVYKDYTSHDIAIIKLKKNIKITSGDRMNSKAFGKLAKPKTGQEVFKCGRTSGTSEGKIISENAVINIHGINKTNKTFKNLIMITGMSCPGDSGSLVVDKNREVVGIIIAHDPMADRTFMHDINEIFSYTGNNLKSRKKPFNLKSFY